MAAIELLSNEFKKFEENDKNIKMNSTQIFLKKNHINSKVKNLYFSYEQEGQKGLKDISFKIKKTQF